MTMENLQAILICFAFLGHALALGLYVLYAFTREDGRAAAGHRVLAVSCFLHGASLAAGVWAETQRPDHVAFAFWSHWFTSLSLFTFLIAQVFLFIQTRTRLAILGVFVLPLVVVSLGVGIGQALLSAPFGSVEGFFRSLDAARKLPAVPTSLLTAIHVPLLFLAYAAFANAFGIGLAFLIGERQLKARRPTELSYRLPSLDEMDKTIAYLVLIAFPVLTLGLAMGAQWAMSLGAARWAADPKVIWSLFIWLVYLSYLSLRYGAGWRGRRTTYLSLIGFALALFTYFGVNYFSRFHGFLAVGGAG